ncbi:M4 family metallopeptidase [Actinomadura geliboluensis]|uniref:Peptidase M4 C-terminal domain-containing protein n=1 Tax=Actinomadura geliboluensis TaxID=882440 RepID=A0A5S4GMV9_9ACTN|nr:hypothetical protein ETD96_25475 [Actinomadura geliboluensis]
MPAAVAPMAEPGDEVPRRVAAGGRVVVHADRVERRRRVRSHRVERGRRVGGDRIEPRGLVRPGVLLPLGGAGRTVQADGAEHRGRLEGRRVQVGQGRRLGCGLRVAAGLAGARELAEEGKGRRRPLLRRTGRPWWTERPAAGLIYQGESGGLNEATSDIMATNGD